MAQDIAHIRASVPEALEAEVMLHMNRLGGVITAVERERDSRTGIGATIPKDHIAALKYWLENYSDGSGFLSEERT
jgi:hypothetical protein